MREYATPSNVTLPLSGSLTDDVVMNGEEHPDAVAFLRRDAQGWLPVDTATFLADVRRVARGLVAAGLETGDRLALLSRTRYEWSVVDYACWYIGVVTVPLYETSADEQICWILEDSGARALVAESTQLAERVSSLAHPLPALEHVWTIDGTSEVPLADLSATGAQVGDEDLEARRRVVTPDHLATLVYTSGTTGKPRGCALTHGNLLYELGVALPELDDVFSDDALTVLFLPLAHVFARIVQVGAVKKRVPLALSADLGHLTEDLETLRPTFLLAVPRVFEKIFNSASQEAAAAGRSRLFDRAVSAAISFSQAAENGRPGPLVRGRHAVYDRVVYAALRRRLGGRCRYVISGGAPLGERLGHFYAGAGIPVLEGYGLTETTGAITVNLPGASRIGTVGRPLPGSAVRISEDGELEVSGGQVFARYWNDDRATVEAFTADGWLRTGDLAEIDDEGFVRVTGRKKEILVTTGGKNVAPAPLEDRLRAHPLISQCMVVGDGQPYVAALLTLDVDAATLWAKQHGLRRHAPADLARSPELLAVLQKAVDEANASVSIAESIRRWRVLSTDWTEESGHLTPSLKVRRNAVARDFRSDIAALFED